MLKIIIMLAFCTVFSHAGTIEKDEHQIEFKRNKDNNFFTKYCFKQNCNEKIFSPSQFSVEMDKITVFVEQIYEDENFFEQYVSESFKKYKESKENEWILDFKGIVVFSVKEEQYQEVIKSKEKIASLLYSFYRQINSEESINKLKNIYESNSKVDDLNEFELTFYKNISKIMIGNKV